MEHGHGTAAAVAQHLMTHDDFGPDGRPGTLPNEHRDVSMNCGRGDREPRTAGSAQHLARGVCPSNHHCARPAYGFRGVGAEKHFCPLVPGDHEAMKIDREGRAGRAGDVGLDLLH